MTLRPYAPLHGMSTAKWKEIPPTFVPLSSLRFCQPHLYVEGMLRVARGEASYSKDPYPFVVKYQGQLFCEDGHHRVVAAIVRGEAEILARVLEKE